MFDECENELIEKIIFWTEKFVGREKSVVYVRYYCSEFNCTPKSTILSAETSPRDPGRGEKFVL